MERLARLKLVSQYFKAGRAAEVFLQTADLNRRPPPPMPDAPGALSSLPPPRRPRRPPEEVGPPGRSAQATGNETVTHVPPESLSTRISA